MSATAAEPTALSTEPDPRRWKALMVIAIAQLMVVLDASIVNIALPSIQDDLGISDADRQWVVTAYTLAFGGLLLLGGRIADFQGRKRMFIVGLIGFAFASFLGGISHDRRDAVRGPRASRASSPPCWPRPPSRSSRSRSPTPRSGRRPSASSAPSPAAAPRSDWWPAASSPSSSRGTGRSSSTSRSRSSRSPSPIPYVKESRATGDTKYDVPGAILATVGLVSPRLRHHAGGDRWAGTAPRRCPSWAWASCCSRSS